MKRTVTFLSSVVTMTFMTACSIGQQASISVLNKLDLIEYKVRDEKIYLEGIFNSRSANKLKSVIRINPAITTLVLKDMEGSLDDEALFPFATWVRNRGLNTHLESGSVISSGAVDLFLAGVERTMENGARLGVHSWSDGDKEASDYPKDDTAHDLNASYIAAMLGSDAFYWFTIEAAPADGMHWMTQSEIKKYGLLTKPVIEGG